MIHEIVADVLDKKTTREEAFAQLTPEQQDVAALYLDTVLSLVTDGARLYVETRFVSEHLHPEWFGTADAVIIKPPRLIVADLKCGRIPVMADYDGTPNPQLSSYAVSILEKLKASVRMQIREVELIIIQPREGGVKRRLVTLGELADMKYRLLDAAKLAEGVDPPAAAGKHCTFCRALPTCQTARQKAQDSAKTDFAEDGAAALPAPDMDEILQEADFTELWIKAVRQEAVRRIEAGDDINGNWELVPTRPTRKWADERIAKQRLLSEGLTDILKEELISPAQAEAMARAKGFKLDTSDLTISESSGVKLARTSGAKVNPEEWS